MKTLIFGAGPLGSLYAHLFQKVGIDITLLARGEHYHFLLKNGIVLKNEFTQEEVSTKVKLVNQFNAQDYYDLVIVIMRKNNVIKIIPELGNNKLVSNILFMGNNVNGFAEYLQFLPQEKVLFGFPGGGGSRINHIVHYVDSDKPNGKRMPITLGEIDGVSTERIINIKNLFESAYVPVKIEENIDGWLKYHAAFILPLAGALLKSGNNYNLAKDKNTIIKYIGAVKEGGNVLKYLGYKNQFPAKIKSFYWNPEWLTAKILSAAFKTKFAEIAMMMHVNSAKDEMEELGKEFAILKNKTSVDASNLEELLTYINHAASEAV